jgi:hypothetical protein
MELAIINGTYRDSSTKAAAAGKYSLHPDAPLLLLVLLVDLTN